MHGTKLMCSTMVNIGQLRFSTCTLSTCEILYVRGPTFDFLFNCLHDHFQPGSFYLFICLVYVIFPMHLVQSFLLRTPPCTLLVTLYFYNLLYQFPFCIATMELRCTCCLGTQQKQYQCSLLPNHQVATFGIPKM